MAKIDEVRVKGVKPIVQQKSSTCWYASFQMLYRWKGRSVKDVEKRIRRHQSQSQKNAKPPIADFDYMYSHGIGTADVKPCARALGLDWVGGSSGDIPIAGLLYGLDKFGPIWITGKWNNASHAIVLVGAKRAKMPMIYFLNPWLQFGGNQEIERPITWLNRGRGHWKNVVGSIIRWQARKSAKIEDYMD